MSVVTTQKLSRSYGRRRGIFDVDLSIGAGEIFGFLGPNGAGKSTTIRVLMGLLRAGSGSASIFGRDCWRDGPKVRSQVGYVAGDVRLYSWLTARRGLRILSQIRGTALIKGGLALAERFHVEPDLPVRKMSRGNRQKIALLLALAPDPPLLVLDEPTSGLDPLMQDTLMDCLRERAAAGKTVLFSSHTLSEVEALCDRVAVIRAGRIVEDSTIASLKARAPRQIVVTLNASHSAAQISWPAGVSVTKLPSTDRNAESGRSRECVLELTGTAAGFVDWAASQRFADVSISPPSLDALFRTYYEEDEGAA